MAETDPVVDTTFGTDGALVDQNVPAQSSANDSPQRVVIQPDNKILVAAYGAAQIRVVRYLRDGTPDPAFGTNGIVTVPTGDSPALGTILLRPDGRILVVASVWRTDNRNLLLVSLTAAGKTDHNFSSDGQVETDLGGSEWARDAVLFDDGSVVVAGERGELGAFPPSGKLLLVRYLKSGSIDKSFGSSGSTAVAAADNPHPRAITVDRAGRFLVVGEAYDYDTGNLGLLARFTPAGKPDPTFRGGGVATIPSGEFVAPVSDVVAEPDGTIVVAGYGGQLGRYSREGQLLVRAYNVYGGVVGGGGAGEARFVRQSDGGLIVVTTWDHSIDSGATNYDIAVVRFTPDLKIDPAFAYEGGLLADFSTFDRGGGIALQPDGNIVVVGESERGLAAFRLLGDAALVPSDDPPSDPGDPPGGPGGQPPGPTNPPVVPASPPDEQPQPNGPDPQGDGHPAAVRSGYWMLTAAGQVFGFGSAADLGGNATRAVDIAVTPSGNGYWILSATGDVYPHGDAPLLGSLGEKGALGRDELPASLSATPDGRGYWVFTNRGRAVPFGTASFLGDMSAVRLNGPILDSVATPSGRGYWMVASDGGIFTFGDARFSGSMGGKTLNKPVISMAPDPDGAGYWLVASDGGIFAFDAPFHGSTGNLVLNKPVSGMVTGNDGYLMVAQDGGIFAFGNVAFHGSLGAKPPASPVVAVALLRR